MFRKITATAAALTIAATIAVAAGPADAARSVDRSGEDATSAREPAGTHTMESDNTPPKGYQTGDTDERCTDAVKAANDALDDAWQAWADGRKAAQNAWEQLAAETAGSANNYDDCNITEIE